MGSLQPMRFTGSESSDQWEQWGTVSPCSLYVCFEGVAVLGCT